MHFFKYLVPISILFMISEVLAEESSYPETASQRRKTDFGSIMGENSGITLYDSNPNTTPLIGKSKGNAMSVNQYLWEASLRTLSFMPLASVDSIGGVIITDWHEDQNYPGERYKVNVFITSLELRVESLKISVFKQVLKNGVWREVPVNSKVSLDLEEKILTQARELQVVSK